MTRPDLFSVRSTSNPARLKPVHDVKVSRACLLSDLRYLAKSKAARRHMCRYVAIVCCRIPVAPEVLQRQLLLGLTVEGSIPFSVTDESKT